MQPFLAEVVDIGNAGCVVGGVRNTIFVEIEARKVTYGIRQGSYRFDIRLEAGAHRSCVVPTLLSVTNAMAITAISLLEDNDTTYKLDSYLLVVQKIGALKDNAK